MRRSLLVTLVPIVVALAACGGDDPPAADAPSTTLATSPSTTAAGGTTTEPPTTSTTSTTAPDPAVEAIALRGDGLGVTTFGAGPGAAVAAVTVALGEPSADTGWQPSFSSYGTCPGEQIRGVEWGALVLLFTDGTTSYGSGEHLFSWRVTGAPPALSTATGLGYGATAADAEELYPGQVDSVPAEDPFPAFLRVEAEGGAVTAFLDAADAITNLEAGVPCGE